MSSDKIVGYNKHRQHVTGVIGDISMRLKKSMINSISNILIYFISMVPLFIVRKVFLNQLGDELLSVNS